VREPILRLLLTVCPSASSRPSGGLGSHCVFLLFANAWLGRLLVRADFRVLPGWSQAARRAGLLAKITTDVGRGDGSVLSLLNVTLMLSALGRPVFHHRLAADRADAAPPWNQKCVYASSEGAGMGELVGRMVAG
jgi:hypothetical protein